MASFLKPMTRAKAEQTMREVISRAEGINADREKLIWVDSLEVFGSYADPSAVEIGDLDILYVLTRRNEDGTEHQRLTREYVKTTQARPRNVFEELYWPELEAKKILRNRSSRISLHDPRDGDYNKIIKHRHLVYRREPRLVQPEIRDAT